MWCASKEKADELEQVNQLFGVKQVEQQKFAQIF
jgi:hypothetical protein